MKGRKKGIEKEKKGGTAKEQNRDTLEYLRKAQGLLVWSFIYFSEMKSM